MYDCAGQCSVQIILFLVSLLLFWNAHDQQSKGKDWKGLMWVGVMFLIIGVVDIVV